MLDSLLFSARTIVVTPDLATPLAGYAARGRALSIGVHDDLEASLFWLRDGEHGVAWLTIDTLGVPAPLTEVLTRTIREELSDGNVPVIVAASHTHAAPLEWVEAAPDRGGDVVGVLVETVRELARTVRADAGDPVTIEYREAKVLGVGANRHAADGPHDDSAGILTFSHANDDRTLGILVDFATHPTVLPASNLKLSADWPGHARKAIRTNRPGAVVGFLQGAAGDVSTRFTRTSQDFRELERIGQVFGAAVLDVLERPGERVPPKVHVALTTVTLPVRQLPTLEQARAHVAELEAALAAVDVAAPEPQVRLSQSRVDGARIQLDLVLAEPSSDLALTIGVVALGPVAWVHLPVELFASFGLALRTRSPFRHTRIIGYSNGYAGYVADDDAHAAQSYEALSSLVDSTTSNAFVAAVQQHLTLVYRAIDEEQ